MIYDIAIIGGGINGCGIARDAAGRGFSVFLAEQNDLASGTSSASTKLIHGGLRYLEHYDFGLVRKALKEREVVLAMAPHIVWPLRFVLPHHPGLRPAWLLRLGLFLYDHMGGRKILPPTRTLDMRHDEIAIPLKAGYRKAFEYSDCWVDDARLVVLNACDAARKGAVIKTRTVVTRARRVGANWHIETVDNNTGETTELKARILVNAAGPWIDRVLGGAIGQNDVSNVRLVKGSHIVVPRLFDHDRCYIFQNSDGRIIFSIPYEQDFTLIGTTDLDFGGDLGAITISKAEIDYLCAAASEYFRAPVRTEQVVWSYSGVRPLYDDGASKAQEATRDYVLVFEGGEAEAKLLNIFGGKITTYRVLAEAALEDIEGYIGRCGDPWTATQALPGGEFPHNGFDEEVAKLQAAYPFLLPGMAKRMVRTYGLIAHKILGSASSLDALGTCFGGDLYQCEVEHLLRNEWAQTADDIIWRRTKLGLRLSNDQVAVLTAWLEGERS